VSTDEAGSAPRLGGNAVSNMFTTLGTAIDDPVERLLEVSRVTAEAKKVQRALGMKMLEDWVQFTPPAPFSAVMRAYSRLRAADLHPAPFNVVVSNVPGPTAPVWIAGAQLTDLFSVGPILQGIGLNVTVWSYLDRMNFSLLACPDLLPDLRGLADRLPGSLQDLLSASG
jgi:diacylglycerol O-acyltransferase